MSLAYRRNTHFWRHHANNSPTVSNRRPRWPNDISSTLITRSSKIARKTSSLATVMWHVALSCWSQMLSILFNFCEQKFIQHGPITIAIHCNGHYLLIFEEKWPNYGSGPKSATNSDPFWVRRLPFNVCVWVSCAPNATILLVYTPAKIKMSFIWKDDFFLPKSACTVNRSYAHFPALFKRIHNHIRSAEG